jgi:hypothetical protein
MKLAIMCAFVCALSLAAEASVSRDVMEKHSQIMSRGEPSGGNGTCVCPIQRVAIDIYGGLLYSKDRIQIRASLTLFNSFGQPCGYVYLFVPSAGLMIESAFCSDGEGVLNLPTSMESYLSDAVNLKQIIEASSSPALAIDSDGRGYIGEGFQ